ncbi:MAG: hypothetical protein EPN92_10330 [Chitinophagaceae bacterium]|nr:MAG: hypothetical protein EPN92_10330 [Chitinophagaceae bacterium]
MRKLWIAFGLCFLMACSKQVDKQVDNKTVVEEYATAKGGPPKPSVYSTYTIQQGQHYCDQSSIKSVRTSEMKFMAKFDNSAIYQTILPENQYDINKLWGFSEGINNQYNSARIGWSWNNDALRLYGYVYANGVRYYQEITQVDIGADISCSIKVSGNTYIFTVNSSAITLPRGPSSSQASGYQQYPYFGGDETAPHLITILIKSL